MSDGGKQRSSSSFHFFAGLCSGTFTSILLQPADLLKTRIQQAHGTTLSATLRSLTSGPSPIRQLWRGTLPSAIRTGFGSALYFGSLNALRTSIARASQVGIPGTAALTADDRRGTMGGAKQHSSALPRLSNTANLLTGAAARAGAGFIVMPVTVIKVRYESSAYSYKSLGGAATDILRKEGLRGFFAGFGATAVRDAPYAGLYLLFYEAGKGWLSAFATRTPTLSATGSQSPAASGLSGSSSVSINFLSGILAASTATAVTNPFDAIKTRLQLYPQRYRNMVVAAKMMLKEEGVRSMFDGLGLRIARKALSSALAWSVYEELIRRAERSFVATATV